MNRLLLVAALLIALPLAAAPKVVVLPFTGKKATAGSTQLSKELCGKLKCVPASKVAKKDKVDWAKAKKEKVTHVISGKLSGKKTEVTVLTISKKNVMKKSYTVGANGRFFGIKDLVSDIQDAVGGGGGEEEEEAPPKKEEKKEEEPPPVKEEKKEEKEETKEEEKKEEVREERVEREETREEKREEKEETREERREEEEKKEEEEPARPSFKGRPPLAIAQLGVDVGPRLYSYSNVTTRNLRSYRAYLIFQPRLRAELYPLATVLRGIPAGIGVEGDFSFAVGLQSSPSGGPSYATRISKLDVGLRLRMMPLEDSKLVINPIVGYRMHNFSTLPADDGSRLEGLADINYTALRLGATVEQPILDDDAAVIGEVVVLPVLGTGSLGDFFPQNSAFGFELGAGFAYTIAPKLQAKVGATLTRYGLNFTTTPGDTYEAEGASDLYANATLAVRYTF